MFRFYLLKQKWQVKTSFQCDFFAYTQMTSEEHDHQDHHMFTFSFIFENIYIWKKKIEKIAISSDNNDDNKLSMITKTH